MPKYQHLLNIFQPAEYDLNLDIDEAKLSFKGAVTITGQFLKKTKILRLHSHELKIEKINSKATIASHKLDTKHQELQIHFEDDQSGKYRFEIQFSGKITEAMVGIYPAKFKQNNLEQTIISTQFESHHAREVFPCIDEPAAKAVFNVTLTTAGDQTVLSNSPIIEQTTNAGRMTTKFAPTLKMSTYLLAFCIGNLKSLEAKSKHGITVRTWATPDNVEHTSFALEVAVKALDEYEKFFDINYQLKKCDLVAVPEFSAGAMENWGLITFRETALLHDPAHSREEDKMWVAAVVIHELAHQWFGNLVTMQWWTDLWLNEGFARWMESYLSDVLFPEWKIWDWFVSSDFVTAQNLDRMESTHAIEIPIDHPDEIRSAFDSISYDKGASVIRMLFGYVGEKDFRDSLRLYIKRHSYKNATTKDLWAAIQEVSNKPIENFMGTWTSKPGFPVMKVTLDDEKLSLSQHRYCVSKLQDQTIWPIPYYLNDEAIFAKKADKIYGKLDNPLNNSHQGFYITDYEPAQLRAFYKRLNELPDTEVMGLAIDQFHLVITGEQPLAEVLENLQYYKGQTSSPVWDVVLDGIRNIRAVLTDGDKPLRLSLNDWIADFIRDTHEKLGWEAQPDDSINELALRTTMVALMVSVEDPKALEAAHSKFKTAKTIEDINPVYRTAVLAAVAKHSPENLDLLLDWYVGTPSARAKSTLATAITSLSDLSKADKVFDFIKSEHVRIQDLLFWIAGLSYNFETRNLAWRWLRDNWDYLRSRFGTDIMMTAYLPVIAGRSLNSKEQLREFDEFFKAANTKHIEAKVKQGRELIAWKAAWHERDQSNLRQWLKGQASQ